ncbi:MAG: hypothetical protein DMF81_02155 [Acidobacteria bacterium]|nr:MAG: hypothetical protein DMF81_02155 [Acidobacteriota bacterium]
MSRRRFIKSLASAPLLPVAFAAPQRPAPLPPASTPAPPPPPPTAAPSPTGTPPGPAAQALGEVVRIRYGPQLEEADLSEVNLQAAERLRSRMKLVNADQPVAVFHARLAAPPPPPAPVRRRR